MKKTFFWGLWLGGLLLLATGCTEYDADRPDTPANRKGFFRQLGIEADSRIGGIYYFADEFIQDPQYFLVFHAPREFIDDLIARLQLEPAAKKWDDGSSSFTKFPWWDADIRRKSDFFAYDDRKLEIIHSLWYDPETKICHYWKFCY